MLLLLLAVAVCAEPACWLEGNKAVKGVTVGATCFEDVPA